MERHSFVFVGIDLHKKEHVAVVCNSYEEQLKKLKVKNSPNQFGEFIKKIEDIAEGKKIIFGLEDVDFYGRSLAKYLIEQGFIVKVVNSSYTKRERSIGTNRNKTDEQDAYNICAVLIRKYTQLPLANPQDIFLAIKQVLNARNYYSKTIASIKNGLHSLLVHNYPTYTEFFPDLKGKVARGFFKKFPSPDLLPQEEEDLHTALKQIYKSVSNDKARQVLDSVQTSGWIPNDYQEANNKAILSYLTSLDELYKEKGKLELELEELIEQTGYPIRTMPGIDTILAATFIANIGDIHRFTSSKQLAKLAGVAPYEHSSGQSKRNYSNKLGNRTLHSAFYTLALIHVQKKYNPIMYNYYQSKQHSGKKKKQALTYVMRRLVNIVFRMMRDKTAYKPPAPLEEEAS
ncbi:IS110 family transposase [Peribacillus asahii]|uniref:IS110 family transposase n=1 Tax=Peribacillus asahii TaxID=228899 RepID=UPI003807D1A4